VTTEDSDRLRRLHETLAATAERPVDPQTSAWLGEAQAIVADVATDPSAPQAAVRRRVEQAEQLLDNVEETGDPAADEHVAEARELVSAILAEHSDGPG
jgi:hypothetical protein